MNSNDGQNDNKGFLFQLHMRAEQKVAEYVKLLRERQHLDRQIELTKQYVEQLNSFLKAEGLEPVTIRTIPSTLSSVGKPGNRSKSLPLRRVQWAEMTIDQIIVHFLSTSPELSCDARDVAQQLYEIDSEADMDKVIGNTRSSLQSGFRKGLWERTERGKYKARVTEQQGALVST